VFVLHIYSAKDVKPDHCIIQSIIPFMNTRIKLTNLFVCVIYQIFLNVLLYTRFLYIYLLCGSAASVDKWVDNSEGWWFKPLDGSSQRLKNCHLLLPWSTFTIKGLTERGIIFICGVVLRCTGILKPGISTDQLQQITDMTTIVVHSYTADHRSDNHCRT